ncbi:MAG: hypothetical protein ACR2RB_16680 [Gammaproteobacteria bacterium]
MDELKLSNQLIADLQGVLVSADERAKDPFVASQYLAAVTGYLVGMQDVQPGDKDEVLEQLGAFAKHVKDDIDQQMQTRKQQQAGQAFGIWKPGDP